MAVFLLQQKTIQSETSHTGIIYVATQAECDAVSQYVKQHLKVPCYSYHTGLTVEQRLKAKNKFTSGNYSVKLIAHCGICKEGFDFPSIIFIKIPHKTR